MRYEIKDSKVIESFFIDAPYDCKEDAQTDIELGIRHNCKKCGYENCAEIANYSDSNRLE